MLSQYFISGLPSHAVPQFILLEDFHIVQPVNDRNVYGLLDEKGVAHFVGSVHGSIEDARAIDRRGTPIQLPSQQYWAHWPAMMLTHKGVGIWRRLDLADVPAEVVSDLQGIFRVWKARWEVERLERKRRAEDEEKRKRRRDEEDQVQKQQMERLRQEQERLRHETEEDEDAPRKPRFYKFEKPRGN